MELYIVKDCIFVCVRKALFLLVEFTMHNLSFT